MPEIEFDPVDTITAGAAGQPGERVFFLHATKEGAFLTVKLEKQQVAVLAERLLQLLHDVAEDVSSEEVAAEQVMAEPPDDVEPLFRALAIGLGFDPVRQMVFVELHENVMEEDATLAGELDDSAVLDADADDADEGFVARLHITPAQARAMAERGARAVAGGRPLCHLCGFPMDAAGHACPATNGHKKL
jgi:uncharacterized repeat protein (TIGR03847 family)